MPRHNRRTQRQRGAPDAVAAVRSTDRDLRPIDSHEGDNDALITAAEASQRHAVAASPDVDLAAGEEFIQMKPNDFPTVTTRATSPPDGLTPEERAAEPPPIDHDQPSGRTPDVSRGRAHHPGAR